MQQLVFFPQSVSEAAALLAQHEPEARIIAGGTDLVLQLRTGEKSARSLVDISGIHAMRIIHANEDTLTIGAGVTHAQVVASPLLKKYAPLLVAACAEIGSPQIRSVGTLGGNVVNAQPAADAALALAALRAEALVRSADGAAWIPITDLYAQPGHSRLDSCRQVLEAFRIRKLADREGSAYRRLGKCKSIALPVICAAAVVRLDTDRQLFSSCSLAIGPAGPGLFQADEAAGWIVGQTATPEVFRQAARRVRAAAHPRSSLLRCAAEYREQMVEVIVGSVLAQAVDFARTGGLRMDLPGEEVRTRG